MEVLSMKLSMRCFSFFELKAMKTLKKSLFILLGCGILIANGSSVFANKSNGINPDLAEDIPTPSSEPIGSEARTAEKN